MLLQNITNILRRINDAEQKFNRVSGSVNVLAVSKGQTVADIEAAFAAGVYCFGENYVQEALPKIEVLKDKPIEWHFIGAIQSNKTALIARHFSWVQSVSTLAIAKRLSAQRPVELSPLNLCLQVNISGEPGKSGASVETVLDLARHVACLPNLRLRGLMAIPKVSHDVNEQREQFHRVAELYQKIVQDKLPLDTLSMGMSGDFESAIAEGATLVRVGTAIFGARW